MSSIQKQKVKGYAAAMPQNAAPLAPPLSVGGFPARYPCSTSSIDTAMIIDIALCAALPSIVPLLLFM